MPKIIKTGVSENKKPQKIFPNKISLNCLKN